MMLRKLEKFEFEKYIEFAYQLALDQTKSSYPTYTDGIKKKEDFINRSIKAFERENEDILLFEMNNQIEGWIHYYVLEEDDYISFCSFNISKNVECAIDEIISYLKKKFPNFNLYFGLPLVNIEAIRHLEKLHSSKIEESFVDIIHFEQYKLLEESESIIKVTKDNYDEFSKLHVIKDDEMYWNTQRLYDHLDEWNIYLYKEKDVIRGAIYFIYFADAMEIFGVDYINNQFNETTFRELLIKALNEGKISNTKHLVYFNEAFEHPTVSNLNFKHVGKYVLYKITL